MGCRGRYQDHPRACGEKLQVDVFCNYSEGSPPRMRGKVLHTGGASVPPRITPAHAGKRSSMVSNTATVRDHPRACGEKAAPSWQAYCLSGSPPRMRGKVHSGPHRKRHPGITPAHARKRTRPPGFSWGPWDHPRACGEKPADNSPLCPIRGSPPRMRGKATPSRSRRRVHGITPAHAGKSWPGQPRQSAR